MLQPEKRPRIVEIIDELVGTADFSSDDQLFFSRYKREVQKLLQNGTGEAYICYMALGIIEYLLGNSVRAEELLQNSYALGSDQPWAGLNYASTCISMGYFEKGLKVVKDLVSKFPNIKSVLNFALKQTVVCLQYSDAEVYLKQVRMLTPNENLNELTHFANSISTSKNLSKAFARPTEAQIIDLLEFSSVLIRQMGCEIRNTSNLQLKDGTAVFWFHIDADSDKCAGISFELAEALVTNFEETFMDALSITCSPVENFDVFRLGMQ